MPRHRPGREGVRKTRLSPVPPPLSPHAAGKVPGTCSCCVCAGGCGSCSCLCCGPFLCLCLFDPFFPGECRVKVVRLIDSLISEIGVAALSLVGDRFVDGPELVVAGGHVWHVLRDPLQVLPRDVCAEVPRCVSVERGSRGAVRGCCCTGSCCFLWGAACSTSSSPLRGGFRCWVSGASGCAGLSALGGVGSLASSDGTECQTLEVPAP